MNTSRLVKNGIIFQGINEKIHYWVNVSNWGSAPHDVEFTVKNANSVPWVDVTATIMPGVADVVGNVITLPELKDIEENVLYYIEIIFVVDSHDNTLSLPFKVYGTL